MPQSLSNARRLGLCIVMTVLIGCTEESSTPKETVTNRLPDTKVSTGSLPRLHADGTQITVSGLSAGAFMATQLQVAYSATFAGVASIAGGPWNCANGSAWNAKGRCMESPDQIDTTSLAIDLKAAASKGEIDGLSNLKRINTYLLNSPNDSVVRPPMAEKLLQFYKSIVPPKQITVETSVSSEHTFPTLDYGLACDDHGPPYISACNFDAAGALLKTLYPKKSLVRATAVPASLYEFTQSEFDDGGSSLAEKAWVYIPRKCLQASSLCPVHVALHGCLQGSDAIKDTFALHAGYNEWAEGSDLIILYPQTYARPLVNPKGCFDWFGYTGPDYAKKEGHQMKAIKAMVDRLISPSTN